MKRHTTSYWFTLGLACAFIGQEPLCASPRPAPHRKNPSFLAMISAKATAPLFFSGPWDTKSPWFWAKAIGIATGMGILGYYWWRAKKNTPPTTATVLYHGISLKIPPISKISEPDHQFHESEKQSLTTTAYDILKRYSHVEHISWDSFIKMEVGHVTEKGIGGLEFILTFKSSWHTTKKLRLIQFADHSTKCGNPS